MEALKIMEEKKSFLVRIITITAAIFLALGSVAYIVTRVISNQRHEEKWSDYDQCGWDL